MFKDQTRFIRFLLFFNKTFINSSNCITNYFLVNNYALFNFFNLNFFFKHFLLITYKKINFNNFRNNKFFLKNFNNFRKYVFFKKPLFKFFFKYNKFFTFSYLNNTKNINYFLLKYYSVFKYQKFMHNFFFSYKNNFFRNWNFLIGFLISPYYTDLTPRRIWTRKAISFYLTPNKLYFNLVSKKKNYIINQKLKI